MSNTHVQSLALFAALFLTLGSIGTVVTVPAAYAHSYGAVTELA